MSDDITALMQQLAAAASTKFGASVDPVTARRYRSADALQSVVDFLKSQGAGMAAISTLDGLAKALLELDEGKVDPIFEPKRTNGKAADPASVWRGRIAVCCAVEMLQAGSFTSKDARKEVVRLVPEFPALRSGRKDGADIQTLQSWLNKLRQRRETPKEMSSLFEAWKRNALQRVEGMNRGQVLAAAKSWLDEARAMGIVFPAS